MKIKTLMTTASLKYCDPDTRLRKAARMMKQRNCGALPVITKEKKVVGIITDRDICLSMAEKHGKSPAKLKVSEIMPGRVFTVNHNDDASFALHEMRTKQVSRLPVVDENGKLAGMLTLHHLINNIPAKDVNVILKNTADESIIKTMRSVAGAYEKNGTSKGKRGSK